MDEGLEPSGDPVEEVVRAPSKEELRRLRDKALGQLRDLDKDWKTQEDSEDLWERKHSLMIDLLYAGESKILTKRAKQSGKAVSGRGAPSVLADAALANWVLESYDDAVRVLMVAVEKLPNNRYPWSLLLRHISDKETPEKAIEFIEGGLDSVPWKTYALIQLGAKHIDIITDRLNMFTTEGCQEHIEAGRRRLEEAKGIEGAAKEHLGTADRLLVLVEHLETRLWDIERIRREAELSGRKPGEPTKKKLFEKELKKVAEASGVALEGEPDMELDLEEVERDVMQEMPEEEQEEKITVIKVTPVRGKKKD
jgi:hypothetical protein